MFSVPPKESNSALFTSSLKLINRVLCVHLHKCDNLDLEVRFNSVSILTTFPRTVSGCANIWQHKEENLFLSYFLLTFYKGKVLLRDIFASLTDFLFFHPGTVLKCTLFLNLKDNEDILSISTPMTPSSTLS